MKKENSMWNPHVKTLNTTTAVDPLKVSQARKQAVEYKLFCINNGIWACDANSLALFFKQVKAGENG